ALAQELVGAVRDARRLREPFDGSGARRLGLAASARHPGAGLLGLGPEVLVEGGVQLPRHRMAGVDGKNAPEGPGGGRGVAAAEGLAGLPRRRLELVK